MNDTEIIKYYKLNLKIFGGKRPLIRDAVNRVRHLQPEQYDINKQWLLFKEFMRLYKITRNISDYQVRRMQAYYAWIMYYMTTIDDAFRSKFLKLIEEYPPTARRESPLINNLYQISKWFDLELDLENLCVKVPDC